MIPKAHLAQLTPPQRAEVIYSQARSELSSRLWQAALGTSEEADRASPAGGRPGAPVEIDTLLAMLAPSLAKHLPDEGTAPSANGQGSAVATEPDARNDRSAAATDAAVKGLGVNAGHEASLQRAAARTGVPAPVIAAVVDAEAAKDPDGSWKTYSRNPRSSAAGLGQFLSGTWENEAERPGTWLNAVARANDWLAPNGQVLAGARSALLSLRYDAEASINATADYARLTLDRLRQAGVEVGTGARSIAHAAYLGHHLGLGDTLKFLKSGLSVDRARQLLGAQVGSANAHQRIAQAGDAAAAHRAWLTSFVERRVRPDQFMG